MTPAVEFSDSTSREWIWQTGLTAMKTVDCGQAGALEADCGEAKLTHCGPRGLFNNSAPLGGEGSHTTHPPPGPAPQKFGPNFLLGLWPIKIFLWRQLV